MTGFLSLILTSTNKWIFWTLESRQVPRLGEITILEFSWYHCIRILQKLPNFKLRYEICLTLGQVAKN